MSSKNRNAAEVLHASESTPPAPSDPATIGRLSTIFRSRMVALAAELLGGSDADAEDVFQDVLLAMLEGELPATHAQLVAKIESLSREAREARALEDLAIAENARLQQENAALAAARVELERLRAIVAAHAGGQHRTDEVSPWEIEDVEVALARARTDFAATLVIPEGIERKTNQNGAFWYHALQALHRLCEIERRGEAKSKRDTLKGLLAQCGLEPKGTYKIADTGVVAVDPQTREHHECRERVHLVEGRPGQTESVYWHTTGQGQAGYQYLIGRIGRHA